MLCGLLLSGGALFTSTPALADTSRGGSAMGIVTTLSGNVTVAREAMPQLSLPLKFKDEVFHHDRISTKERSLARVLLGGKSLVTVRELSDLTITDEPGRPSFISLLGGKISLAVAKLRMRPGEAIEVRTPNAIAAVRGTVLVVEVTPMLNKTAIIPDARPRHALLTGEDAGAVTPVALGTEYLTTIHVLKGNVDVFDLAGKLQGNLQAGFNMTVVGGAFGKPTQNPPTSQVVGDLKSDPQITDPPPQTIETLSLTQQADLKALGGGFPFPFVPNFTPSPTLNVVIPTTGSNLGSINSSGRGAVDHGE
jgi:hypothetical protein